MIVKTECDTDGLSAALVVCVKIHACISVLDSFRVTSCPWEAGRMVHLTQDIGVSREHGSVISPWDFITLY